MRTRKITIKVDPHYDVTIGAGILGCCGALLKKIAPQCRVAIITDATVADLYLKTAEKSLSAAGYMTEPFVFCGGEQSKNIETLSRILEFLAENRFTRSDIIVALGGGVVGDIAGFAAGIYARGIRYAQIPTTLLAAVDSSVGGKTAINLNAGKNLAGFFHQPVSVLCDPSCLSTLPPDIFAGGAAESIKHGILASPSLFSIFDSGNVHKNLPEIIARCISVKKRAVEEDEFDTGSRQLLNLGHTIGHAVEKLSRFSVPHGHAVAIGTVLISRAAEKMEIATPGISREISHVFLKNHLPVSTCFSAQELSSAALSDKKRSGGEIALVLPRRIGECFLKTFPVGELERIIGLGLEE